MKKEKIESILFLIFGITVLSLCFSIFSFFIIFDNVKKIGEIRELKNSISNLERKITTTHQSSAPPDIEPPSHPTLAEGDPAPILKLPDVNGNIVSFAKYRNEKNLLLYAWVPGCTPCEKTTPQIIEFLKKYSKELNFEVLTVTRIAYEEEIKGIKDYIIKNKITLPVLVSTPKDSFGNDYKVSTVPTIWIISPDLKILAAFKGEELTKRPVEETLLEILK